MYTPGKFEQTRVFAERLMYGIYAGLSCSIDIY